MPHNRLKRQRDRMMEQDPHCMYCGIEVIYYPLKKHETMPDNFATIEHINSKLNPKRHEPIKPNERRHGLACNKCNFQKAKEEAEALPPEEHWKRSGSYPLGHPLCKDRYAE